MTRVARPLLLLVLVSCPDMPGPVDPVRDPITPPGPGETVAVVIVHEEETIGGPMAESRPGDLLLINDRARFVLQGTERQTMGLVGEAGGLLDADLARGPDEVGLDLDLVTDAMPFLDVGWYGGAESIEVVDPGGTNTPAVVQVQATDVGFAYLNAVFENPPSDSRGLTLSTTFTLPPDSPLMRVDTTVSGATEPLTLRPGDVFQTAPGVTTAWVPGLGRRETTADAQDAVMMVHIDSGLTLGIFADDRDGSASPEASLDVISLLLALPSLFEAQTTLEPDETLSWSRYWGVGASPAHLTDAWLDTLDVATRTVQATVVQNGAPVAGAWVTVEVDGAPFTLAISDAEGRVEAQVPEGADVRLVADAHGDRMVHDLEVDVSAPLASRTRREEAIDRIEDRVPSARPGLARVGGRAEGAPGDELALPPSATLNLTADVPFEVRLRALDTTVADDVYAPAPPGGLAYLAHSHTGALSLAVAPGRYAVEAWHGVRWEVHEAEVSLAAGDTLDHDLDGLEPGPAVLGAPQWFTADTHIHAVPSFDGKVSPPRRALGLVASGVDLWVASEHDVSVDHRALVGALGLSDRLHVVGSQEVTPWVRGHVNLFPTTADPEARAGGAWVWWEELVSTTTEQFEILAEREPDALVQINHPFSPGMPSFAGWDVGTVRNPNLWWDGFDALEVVVPGQDPKGLTLYADVSARGVLSAATGSSDSHDLLQNDPGQLITWVWLPDAVGVRGITDADVIDAFQARHTLASNGPFAVLDPPPGSTVAPGTELSIEVMSPSWIVPDRVILHVDGVAQEPLPLQDGRATITLDATADASIVVELRGDTPMRPRTGRGPWLVASAYQVDVGEDGWTPPLAPIRPR